jgi:toxin YhaV
MITVNPVLSGVEGGWTLYAHPLFLGQIEKLTTAVERSREKDPKTYVSTANAKLLAAMRKLMFEVIPVDPTRPEFRQGGTLGPSRKHWFRAKFGGGRFRLFFRYSSSAKIIIYTWVNDANTLRTYGSKSDAYAVFKAMLDRGNPPEDWSALIAQSSELEGG